jgi:anion-transporting  ArsA/GET3 family ATPase
MAMERLLEAVESRRYDLVVLDTPPEHHALDFLDAPSRLDALLGSDTFRLFVAASSGLSRAGLEAIRFRRVVLRGIGKFAGEETFLQLLDFVLAFAPMFDGFRERAARVRTWLTGSGCSTFLVCRPGPGGDAAVRSALPALVDRGIAPAGVIVNRVRTWPPAGAPDAPEALASAAAMKAAFLGLPALGLLDRESVADLAGRTLATARRYRALARGDADGLASLRAAVAPTPVSALPLAREEVKDLSSLARFARVVREVA